MSWLDVKLGFRMLRKYPGLALAGGLALAIAIGLGAGWYDFSRDFFRPALPLPGGDRAVEIEMRDALAGEEERRLLHDFVNWRREVRSVEDLGAYRTQQRNLSLGNARPEPVTVAETTASAFRVARVPPLVGRPLLDGDEQPGAPPVLVPNLWTAAVGPRFFESFDVSLVAGRDFHDGDRADGAAGNIVLLLIVGLSDEGTVSEIWNVLLITSAVMLAVILLACVEPAWRALRISPTDALKEA